jgi:dihydrofolate synthase / folylpolyglutamate synthase
VTPREALQHFSALAPSNIKMGLERVRMALAQLGHPESEVPALHVAGTNGKGSTCAIAASCLSQRYKTGLYTSPHLVRPNERIQIDGRDIDDETFGRRISEVLAVLGLEHELTYFEFGTVVAFWHFAQERVDLAVLETGLGGRLDATTACVPQVTCITALSLDHTEYLGHSIESIAAEKAGILKPQVPVVLAAGFPLEAVHSGVVWKEGREFALAHGTFTSARRTVTQLTLGHLKGEHQLQNLSLAMACLTLLEQFPLTDNELRRGVARARWPGRLEEFEGTPLVVLDGAHNPAGADVLRRAIETEYGGRRVSLVFGVFRDKDSQPMMSALFPRVATVHLCPVCSPRSADPGAYAAFAATLNQKVSVHGDALAALAAARAQAGPDGVVIVAGSLVLVGEVRRHLIA